MFNNKDQIRKRNFIPMFRNPKGIIVIDNKTYTKKVSPLWSLLGLFGFIGFNGLFQIPKTFFNDSLPYPYFFLAFSFFGYFGCYYEAKMSNTLIDERFEANSNKATAIANRIALNIILITTIITLIVLTWDPNIVLSIVMAAIGIAWGLADFLKQYLLYRFENEDNEE